MSSDFLNVGVWWLYLFGIGTLFLPVSLYLFPNFFDKGYIFSKAIALCVVSYIMLLFGIFHVLPFERNSIIAILFIILIFDIYLIRKGVVKIPRKIPKIFIIQEIVFLIALIFWSHIKSFQPDVHGLEKYMDFGFMNSILRTSYLPPVDMWYPPHSINYYYFGHLVTALLIKLSQVPTFVAFNLMLSTIFAFTITSSFSIAATLAQRVLKSSRLGYFAGILGALITTFGGNLHTLYTLFKPYSPPENPVPFWQLQFQPNLFPNSYWYPNATRFIPFTIHEFPSYSFVVSDLHGHVLDIPFVFLTLALILSVFIGGKLTYKLTVITSFMLAVMYMTNAWDGIIYFLLLFLTIILWKSDKLKIKKRSIQNKGAFLISSLRYVAVSGITYALITLPFNAGFKPFVSGIGVLCAPKFLLSFGKIGPLIFEADHCQRTPFWMLIILYGFFYFFAIVLILKILKLKKTPPEFIYILLLILVSTILIAAPEFIYAKDIYPAHYRANTMFKLGYQAFLMLSIVTSFSIVYILKKGKKIIWLPISLTMLIFVLMYSYFAVNSYFGELKNRKGLDGLSYMKISRPEDYEAILWIQKNIKGQPVIGESQGDSYTDHGRISANTGLPTILGWTVHEWLWRGDYSYPNSRLEDVRLFYEGSIPQTLQIIKKYNISYAYIGDLEREKYTNIDEKKFDVIGKIVFQKNKTKIYKL